nr:MULTISPECIES: hypothetical protein [unclassified Streptomyces]
MGEGFTALPAQAAAEALPGELVATLKTPEGSRFSELERLRRPPTGTTGTAFARALERVDEIGAYRLGRLRLSQIPPNRMAALARYALGSKAPLLERVAEPKRTAMLTAVMRHLEAKAIDEALGKEDIARLSPLKHRNLNLLGRYSCTASTPAAGALRPLRDPDAPELDEDDDGGQE